MLHSYYYIADLYWLTYVVHTVIQSSYPNMNKYWEQHTVLHVGMVGYTQLQTDVYGHDSYIYNPKVIAQTDNPWNYCKLSCSILSANEGATNGL